jgi:hypothetical protein
VCGSGSSVLCQGTDVTREDGAAVAGGRPTRRDTAAPSGTGKERAEWQGKENNGSQPARVIGREVNRNSATPRGKAFTATPRAEPANREEQGLRAVTALRDQQTRRHTQARFLKL